MNDLIWYGFFAIELSIAIAVLRNKSFQRFICDRLDSIAAKNKRVGGVWSVRQISYMSDEFKPFIDIWTAQRTTDDTVFTDALELEREAKELRLRREYERANPVGEPEE